MARARIRKNFLRRIIFNAKVVFLFSLVIIILISIPLVKKINQKYRIDSEIKELEKEISELENKNVNLKNFMDYLESDQFIEEQARLQFGLKKEGEKAVVIKIEEPESSKNILKNSDIDKTAVKLKSNIGKWFNYFFGRNHE